MKTHNPKHGWGQLVIIENRAASEPFSFISRADRDGSLAAFFKPNLTPRERTVAQVESRILGVAQAANDALVSTREGADNQPPKAGSILDHF